MVIQINSFLNRLLDAGVYQRYELPQEEQALFQRIALLVDNLGLSHGQPRIHHGNLQCNFYQASSTYLSQKFSTHQEEMAAFEYAVTRVKEMRAAMIDSSYDCWMYLASDDFRQTQFSQKGVDRNFKFKNIAAMLDHLAACENSDEACGPIVRDAREGSGIGTSLAICGPISRHEETQNWYLGGLPLQIDSADALNKLFTYSGMEVCVTYNSKYVDDSPEFMPITASTRCVMSTRSPTHWRCRAWWATRSRGSWTS